jgi:hypothetical protein
MFNQSIKINLVALIDAHKIYYIHLSTEQLNMILIVKS